MRSKLPNTGTTIFSTMSALANAENAINLSQGFPEFDCDENLQNLVTKHMNLGHNQYAPMPGLIGLREALAAKLKMAYPVNPDADEITVTAGGTQAIFTAISAVVEPGDEVVIFDPAYDCYEPAIRLNNGIPIHINLNFPNFDIPWEKVESCVSDKTKLIIINNPHNPAGTVWERSDFERLTALCEKHNVFILSDEVYEHITFDQHKHLSVLDFEALYKRAFVVFSFGKTFHNTGWKMGYCVAPETLTTEFRKIHQYLVFSCNTPVQYALAEYISNPTTYQGLSDFYQKKRDIFVDGVKNSRFELLPCSGTYFQLLDYSAISNEKDVDFAKRLTIEYKVASIPISVFYMDESDNKVLRFCFAKHEETLLKATEILCKI